MKKNMMLTIAICMLLLLAAVPSASAATCASTGTYATLIALGPGGCTLDGGALLFTNFAFAGSSAGAATPTAASVSYITEDPGTSTQTGQNVFGFLFNPGFSVSGFPNTSQDAALVYDITVVGATRISSIHLFENATTAPPAGTGVASVSELDTACVSAGNCSFVTDSVTTVGGAVHNDVLGLNLISLHVTKDINVTTGTANGSSATISLVRDSVDVNTPPPGTPEPATYSYMLGGGLLMLGALRRRKA